MSTPTDGSYRDRILGLIGETDPIPALATSAQRIQDAAARLGAAGLARTYAPGKWTGREILAHLADCEVGIGFRIRQILSEDGYRIQPFDENRWARYYATADGAIALQSFLALRAWTLVLLRQLSPQDLAREAVHPERGPETLGVVIRLLAGHDLNHLAQLDRL